MAHQARKRFGQNFLRDEGAIAAILSAVAARPGDTLVEIGPGQGALTAPLLAAAGALHAVEIDRDLAAALARRFPALTLHGGDALDFDFAALGSGLRVVGNLPYNISTPLLFHLADQAHAVRDLHVMLQKEVVERMAAAAGDSEYSRLSVMLQHRFEIEHLFDIAPESFDPRPRVTSAFARLIPRRPLAHPVRDEALFARVVTAAFAQRRKTLRNTLRDILAPADFEALGVDAGARAQELSVAQFAAIADHVSARGSR